MELIDAEFDDWLEDVQVKTLLGEGAWDKEYQDPQGVPAMWSVNNKLVVGSDGLNKTSSVQLQCGARWRDAFAEGSQVLLPGDPRTYTVISVQTWPGEDSHLEVALL